MQIKNRELFERLVAGALAQEFSGWDFNYTAKRWIESPTSWNYPEIVRRHIRPEIFQIGRAHV